MMGRNKFMFKSLIILYITLYSENTEFKSLLTYLIYCYFNRYL